MNCSDCKYFVDEGHRLNKSGNRSQDESKNEAAGTCRRYAPSARNGNWRAWPTVIASDHCYDWQQVVKAVPQPPPAPPPAPPPIPATIPIEISPSVPFPVEASRRGRPRKA